MSPGKLGIYSKDYGSLIICMVRVYNIFMSRIYMTESCSFIVTFVCTPSEPLRTGILQSRFPTTHKSMQLISVSLYTDNAYKVRKFIQTQV